MKSTSLQTWLFGYELSDTLLIFSRKDKTLHAVASKKKTALVMTQAEKAKAAGFAISTYTKTKGEDGSSQISEAFKAAGVEVGTKVGKVLKVSGLLINYGGTAQSLLTTVLLGLYRNLQKELSVESAQSFWTKARLRQSMLREALRS